ncbi:MAG: hypothetical protein ACP5UF_07945 [Hydrogenobaculum sp.]
MSKNISLKALDFSKSILSILALVSPTGVGKTTTIAKLAYMYKTQGFKTGVITLDSYRDRFCATASVLRKSFRDAS